MSSPVIISLKQIDSVQSLSKVRLLWPHGLQHTRVLCPLPSLDLCSDLCPLSGWCYLTISFSAGLFSFTFSLFQHQGLFQWAGSLYRWSLAPMPKYWTSASVLLVNIQIWFPLGLTDLTSLLPKGLSRVFSSTTIWKHQLVSTQPSLWSNSPIHTWLLEKPQLWWKWAPLSCSWL